MNATKGSADPQPEGEQDTETVSRHCDKLMEHFDSVRIFVTRYSNGSTRTVTKGRGCFYTQQGQVKEWVIQQDEMAREQVRRESNGD